MKKEIIYKYGDRKFIVQFDNFHDSFELFGSSHDDNLFLINNEDEIRKKIKECYKI